jgi:7-keto-8-aminopelargonate synthetase-like enzyme
MSLTPLNELTSGLKRNGLVRFFEHYEKLHPDTHFKDLTVQAMDDDRGMWIGGKRLVNFGSDSFLGLDRHPRVLAALKRGVDAWGAHNGTSRAFSSVEANVVAEAKLAQWLRVEDTLIYPSVTLTNLGAIPALVGRQDIVLCDQLGHQSLQEGMRLAQAAGVRTGLFPHADPDRLREALDDAGEYRQALVCVDGIYSMSGTVPPLAELDKICRERRAVLYVDDAHAMGVHGEGGRGTALEHLADLSNCLIVGSLSKAFSCFGGFITCSSALKKYLKMRSTSFVFGGPVPPPYLEAVCEVCDILMSPEYATLAENLHANIARLVRGLAGSGISCLGGKTPIVTLVIGDEEDALRAGKDLYDLGYYVQSVTFPAVEYHKAVLRIQVNANHRMQDIDGLVRAVAEVVGKSQQKRRAA